MSNHNGESKAQNQGQNQQQADGDSNATLQGQQRQNPAQRSRRFTIPEVNTAHPTRNNHVDDDGSGTGADTHRRRRRQSLANTGYSGAAPPSSERRNSLAYADLMAVFYPANTLAQPTVAELPLDAPFSPSPASASWEPTLERAIRSIVSIKAQCVRSFDTETSGTYTATGFVVDVEAGLILSNRHVVNPGPVVAQAVFVNYEEVELQAVYRDPVHDFGFFRFDPAKLKFMEAEAIRLAPHKAKVGMEIRVVGNDAGEKLSILAGTLARLDRTAPEYGLGEYNDFNTFYMQAASGTSGGSSGSPVLDIAGDAVALNAGGASKAASSFYLPLDRVVRALRLVRRGQCVARGTVQAELEHVPYDGLRRLGLPLALEQRARAAFPQAQGMLAVRAVLRSGPAHGHLRAGDIVVAVDGAAHSGFASFEAAEDAAVGRTLAVSVWRGDAAHDAQLHVQDLHAITPSRFVEFGGGVVNELSYQVARSYGAAVGGVYVASSGHALGSAGAWRGSVLQRVGNVDTPGLDAFVRAVAALREGARVPVRFVALDRPHKQRVGIMHVATRWHALRLAARDDATGRWEYSEVARPAAGASAAPQTVAYHPLPASLDPAGAVWRSFVGVEFHAPFLVDGMRAARFQGPGLVVDAAGGLVVCDRDTVPIALGDVYVTVAASAVLRARVELLHPTHNFALVRYDAAQLAGAPPVDLPLHADFYSGARRLEQGDAVHVVAVSADQTPVVRRTRVAARAMVATAECAPPRFRCVNAQGLRLNDQPPCLGGVLCDERGRVQALWVSVSSQDAAHKDTTAMLGLDISVLRPALDALRTAARVPPPLRSLDADLWPLRPAAARALGLSDARLAQTEAAPNAQLLSVSALLACETPAARALRVGDVVLECGGAPVRDVSALAVVAAPAVDLVVLRDGREQALHVETTELDAMETRRVVHWCGALVQRPYRAVLEQVQRLPSAVYISCTLFGSPANAAGLRPGMWVTEIDGRAVATLDDFAEALDAMRSGAPRYVRVAVAGKNLVARVLSLRVDNHYWPPWELVHDEAEASGWRMVEKAVD